MKKHCGMLIIIMMMLILALATSSAADLEECATVVQQGVDWLLAHQNADGTWGTGSMTQRDTAVVLEVLRLTELVDNDFILEGENTVARMNAEIIDWLARQVIALENSPLGVKKSAELAQGDNLGWDLNRLDRALRAEALSFHATTYPNILDGFVHELPYQQSSDGSFSYDYGQEGHVAITAHYLKALCRLAKYTDIEAIAVKAAHWLSNCQNPDGGWGDPQSTIQETALVCNVLQRILPVWGGCEAGLAYLLGQRQSDGGWGDAYHTALAVECFYYYRPNLNLRPGDLQIYEEDGTWRIDMALRNQGPVDTGRFRVQFSDGPSSNGNKIGEALEIEKMEPGKILTIQMPYDLTGREKSVYVLVDAGNEIIEWNESDNELGIKIPVGIESDLRAHSDLKTYPTFPSPNSDTVLMAEIENMGSTPVRNVRVRFYSGYPEQNGIVLGDSVFSEIGPGEAVVARLMQRMSSGRHTIVAVVDPDFVLPELDRSDNRVLSVIEVAERYDFSIDPCDEVAFYPGETEMELEIGISNHGSDRAAEIQVAFYGQNPELNAEVEPFEVLVIPEIVGYGTETINYALRQDAVDSALYVLVDPENVFHELNEGNNTDHCLITVMKPSNLALSTGTPAPYPDILYPESKLEVHIEALISNPDPKYDFYHHAIIKAYWNEVAGEPIFYKEISLYPGESENLTVFLETLPTTGMQKLIIVGAQPGVPEVDETDNRIELDIPVIERPFNLAVSPGTLETAPNLVSAGQLCDVVLTVHNQSPVAAEPFIVEYSYSYGQEWIPIGQAQVSGIDAMSTTLASVPWQIPMTAGKVQLKAVVDPRTQLSELRRDDNEVVKTINISLPQGHTPANLISTRTDSSVRLDWTRPALEMSGYLIYRNNEILPSMLVNEANKGYASDNGGSVHPNQPYRALDGNLSTYWRSKISDAQWQLQFEDPVYSYFIEIESASNACVEVQDDTGTFHELGYTNTVWLNTCTRFVWKGIVKAIRISFADGGRISEVRVLSPNPVMETSFIDAAIEPGESYCYYVVAVNQHYQTSLPSQPVFLAADDANAITQGDGFWAKFSGTSNMQVFWDRWMADPYYTFRIYCNGNLFSGEVNPIRYGTVQSAENRFLLSLDQITPVTFGISGDRRYVIVVDGKERQPERGNQSNYWRLAGHDFDFKSAHSDIAGQWSIDEWYYNGPPVSGWIWELPWSVGEYNYVLVGVDSHGQEHELSSLLLEVQVPTEIPAPEYFSVRDNEDGKGIHLNWNRANASGIAGYRIYKNGEAIQEGALISDNRYLDMSCERALFHTDIYEVAAVTIDGREGLRVEKTLEHDSLTVDFVAVMPTMPRPGQMAEFVFRVGNHSTESLHDVPVELSYVAYYGSEGWIDWADYIAELPAQTDTTVIIPWENEAAPGRVALFVCLDHSSAETEFWNAQNPAFPITAGEQDLAAFPMVELVMQPFNWMVDTGTDGKLLPGVLTIKENGQIVEDICGVRIEDAPLNGIDAVIIFPLGENREDIHCQIPDVIERLQQTALLWKVPLNITVYGHPDNSGDLTPPEDFDDYVLLEKGWRLGKEIALDFGTWAAAGSWLARNHHWSEGYERVMIVLADECGTNLEEAHPSYYCVPVAVTEQRAILSELAAELTQACVSSLFIVDGHNIYEDQGEDATFISELTAATVTVSQNTPMYGVDYRSDISTLIENSRRRFSLSWVSPMPGLDGTTRRVSIELSQGERIGEALVSYQAPTSSEVDLSFQGELQISNVTPHPGQEFIVEAMAMNQGGSEVRGTKVTLIAAGEYGSTIIADDVWLDLNPGQSKMLRWSVAVAAGSNQLAAMLEAPAGVAETNLRNNAVSVKIFPQDSNLPELAVLENSMLCAPSAPIAGSMAEIRAKVINYGRNVGPFGVSFFRGDPELGIKIADVSVDGLEESQMAQITVPWDCPVEPGNYSLWMVIDSQDKIAEGNRVDNRAELKVTVAPLETIIGVTTDRGAYEANSDVLISVSIGTMPGSKPQACQVAVLDPQRKEITRLGLELIDNPSSFLPGWHYRIPISVPLTDVATGQWLSALVDFEQILIELEVEGQLDPNSIRVVTKDQQTVMPAKVTLEPGRIWRVEWKTPEKAVDELQYWLYFDTSEHGPKPPGLKVSNDTWLAAINDCGQIYTAKVDDLFAPYWKLVGQIGDYKSYPRTAVMADFNRDGFPDLAVGMNDAIYILPGSASGTFYEKNEVAVLPGTNLIYGLAAGDLNNDGWIDLVAGRDLETYIMYGIAEKPYEFELLRLPTIEEEGVGTNEGAEIHTRIIVDFDRDGQLDIIVGYVTPYLFMSGTYEDLFMDIVVFYRGRPDGTMEPARFVTYGVMGGDGLCVGDFDEDGRMDIFCSGETLMVRSFSRDNSRNFDTQSFIWYGEPEEELWERTALLEMDFRGHLQCQALDINLDGHLDILGYQEDGIIKAFYGNGDGSFYKGVPLNYPGGLGMTLTQNTTMRLTVKTGQAEQADVQTATYQYRWNTASHSAGDYAVIVETINSAKVTNSAVCGFRIAAEESLQTRLAVDKPECHPGDKLEAILTIANRSCNAPVDGAKAELIVKDAQEIILSRQLWDLAPLPIGGSSELLFTWDTTGMAAGEYRVESVVVYGDGINDHQSIAVTVERIALLQGKLTSGVTKTLPGGTVNLSWVLTNAGNADCNNMQVHIVYVDDSGTRITLVDTPITLLIGEKHEGAYGWATSELSDGNYPLLLEVAYDGQTVVLDDSGLIIDGTPPVSKLQIGSPGFWEDDLLFVTASTPITITAVDNLCGLDRIEIRIDDGEFTETSGSFTMKEEGRHQIEYLAVDRLDNTESARICHVYTDNSAPQTQVIPSTGYFIGNKLIVKEGATVILKASDTGSGVERILARYGDGEWFAYAEAIAITDQITQLSFQAIDRLGNKEEIAEIAINIEVSGTDLAVLAQEISFSPMQPKAGQDVQIEAVIHNLGPVDTKDVRVAFHKGDPRTGGLPIGEQLVSAINAGDVATVQQLWPTQANMIGTHQVFVQIITEDNLDPTPENNVTSIRIQLEPAIITDVTSSSCARVLVFAYRLDRGNCSPTLDFLKDALQPYEGHYEIVYDTPAFLECMRSGEFDAYVITDYWGTVSLHNPEIRERVNAGETVIVMGLSPRQLFYTDPMLGVKYLAPATVCNAAIKLPGDLLPIEGTTYFSGMIDLVQVTGSEAQVAGWIETNKVRYPAIVLNNYGRGHVGLWNFNPAMTKDPILMQQVFRTMLTTLAPEARSEGQAGKVSTLKWVCNSAIDMTNVRLVATLPTGAEIINAHGGIVTSETVTWDLDCTEAEPCAKMLTVRWPKVPGQYGVHWEVAAEIDTQTVAIDNGTAKSPILADDVFLIQDILAKLDALEGYDGYWTWRPFLRYSLQELLVRKPCNHVEALAAMYVVISDIALMSHKEATAEIRYALDRLLLYYAIRSIRNAWL